MPRIGTLRKNYLRAQTGGKVKGTKHLEKLKIKKDDTVEVISGAEKGTRGRVLRAIPADGTVVVQGVNRKWKHLKRTQQNPQGGRLQREEPIHVCKVRKVD